MEDIARRRTLNTLSNLALAAGAASVTSGCCLFVRRPTPICTNSPAVSYPTGPLTIDAHCHVFNGTDLQIEKFMSMVAVNQGGALGAGAKFFGAILQRLAWKNAPNGDDELAELGRIASELSSCSSEQQHSAIQVRRDAGYVKAVGELKRAAREVKALPRTERFAGEGHKLLQLTATEVAVQDFAIAYIESLPDRPDAYPEHQANKAFMLKSAGRSFAGMVDFVIQGFQYRYVNVHDYLSAYNRPGERVIDLMLPSMVDYDYWLARGARTMTKLPTQVEVMRNISIMTGGRVHAFAPFDPLRQLAFRDQREPLNSLQLVQDAVRRHGCMGVKLYPPMGFAALGNETVNKDFPRFWDRGWLPGWTANPGLGKRLDDELRLLYKWCQDEEVPLMAHTGASNGVIEEFEGLTAATYWRQALSEFPRLRINFGHFGGSAPVQAGLKRTKEFMALMGQATGAPGSNAFADAGYFVEVLDSEPKLRAVIQQLYEDIVAGRAPLSTRFMYGTDWEMTLTEGGVNPYLQDFVMLFNELEAVPRVKAQGVTGLASRFFGRNAADWAGLRKGGAARTRLDAFYNRNNVPTPDWANKVDSLPV